MIFLLLFECPISDDRLQSIPETVGTEVVEVDARLFAAEDN